MSFKDCWTYVRSDLYRITGNKSLKLGDLLRNGFFDIGFRFMFGSGCNAFPLRLISFPG